MKECSSTYFEGFDLFFILYNQHFLVLFLVIYFGFVYHFLCPQSEFECIVGFFKMNGGGCCSCDDSNSEMGKKEKGQISKDPCSSILFTSHFRLDWVLRFWSIWNLCMADNHCVFDIIIMKRRKRKHQYRLLIHC